jgi:hypothetical protein
MFFPALFDDSQDFQARLQRKERILAMCDVYAGSEEEREEATKKLYEAGVALLNLFRPKNFVGAKSYEVAFEKNFQVLCHSLNSHTNENVKNMTVLEAYSLMEMLKKQNKENG